MPGASDEVPDIESSGSPSNASLLGLAPDGVCRAMTVASHAVGSYPTVSPLPTRHHVSGVAGGLFSVALSSRFPSPGVTRHPTLWSPDFPPAANTEVKRPAIALMALTGRV